MDPSEWRKILGLKMSKEDRKNNAKVNKANREGKSKKELGLRGRVTVKHLSINFSNSFYGLNLKIKDNNQSDAIGLASAWIIKNK